MQVKDIMPRKIELETQLKNLQSLETLFRKAMVVSDSESPMAKIKYAVDSIETMAELDMPIDKLITEARMRLFEEINRINITIENATISHI